MSTKMTMIPGCSVVAPTLVYAWPTKEEFDKLAVVAVLHDWRWLMTPNGTQWDRRVHSKTVSGAGITVIFQWFEERAHSQGDAA